MKYLIKTFQDEDDKKRVGFKVVNSNGNVFLIDKVVPKAGTDEEIIAAAQEASQPEIDEWQASFSVIGREWDAETNSFVPEPEPEEESNE
jgi:hypothetical protein